MCTLMNMCIPFEVRFLGTYIEDLGKRDYNYLRDTEHKANQVSDVAELTSIADSKTRTKLALYLALLHSCNHACALSIFKHLANFDYQKISTLLTNAGSQNEGLLEELLLLYTMALNHPAFSYEQKNTFGNFYAKLQEEEAKLERSKGPAATSNKIQVSNLYVHELIDLIFDNLFYFRTAMRLEK